jgi:hypothetical protein
MRNRNPRFEIIRDDVAIPLGSTRSRTRREADWQPGFVLPSQP